MDFTEKIGPLPAYAWGGIVGVGIIGFSYMQRKQQSNAVPVDTGGYTPVVSDASGFPILGPGNMQTSPGAAPVNVAEVETNSQWLLKSVIFLTTNGQSPLDVQIALEKYLSGSTLSATQKSIVDKAIAKYGIPPDGVAMIPSYDPAPVPVGTAPPVTTTPQPTVPYVPPTAPYVPPTIDKVIAPPPIVTVPGNTPSPNTVLDTLAGYLLGNGSYSSATVNGQRVYTDATGKTYTGSQIETLYNSGQRDINGSASQSSYITVSGDTLGSVTRRFYGSDTVAGRQRIIMANGLGFQAVQGQAFPVGTRLTIPKAV